MKDYGKLEVLRLAIEPRLFVSMQEGWALFLTKMPQRTTIGRGAKLPISCLFDIYPIHVVEPTQSKGTKVGYYFCSQFQVENKGAFLVTYLNKGRGKATEVETLVRTDDLIIYNVPNKGTIAVTPDTSPALQVIIAEQ